jgi:hypothetical protein
MLGGTSLETQLRISADELPSAPLRAVLAWCREIVNSSTFNTRAPVPLSKGFLFFTELGTKVFALHWHPGCAAAVWRRRANESKPGSSAAFQSASFPGEVLGTFKCRGTISRKKRMTRDLSQTKKSGLQFGTSIRNYISGRVTSRQLSPFR